MVIAHVSNHGDLEYFNVCDNVDISARSVDSALAPAWLKERVALLRLCDINKESKGESIGRRFTDHMLYVYLSNEEFHELNELSKQECNK